MKSMLLDILHALACIVVITVGLSVVYDEPNEQIAPPAVQINFTCPIKDQCNFDYEVDVN